MAQGQGHSSSSGGSLRVLVVGAVPADVLDSVAGTNRVERWPVPDGQSERAAVSALIALGRRVRTGTAPLLIVTDRDLSLPECASLFGFADRRRQIAIVSTARLTAGVDEQGLQRRLRNAIAHELGHLAGLRHCPTTGCLMHAARTAADLDTRRATPCGRCPRKVGLRQALEPAVGYTLLAALVLGVSALLAMTPYGKAGFQMPFT